MAARRSQDPCLNRTMEKSFGDPGPAPLSGKGCALCDSLEFLCVSIPKISACRCSELLSPLIDCAQFLFGGSEMSGEAERPIAKRALGKMVVGALMSTAARRFRHREAILCAGTGRRFSFRRNQRALQSPGARARAARTAKRRRGRVSLHQSRRARRNLFRPGEDRSRRHSAELPAGARRNRRADAGDGRARHSVRDALHTLRRAGALGAAAGRDSHSDWG